MRKCPHCAEEIQDDARICKWCHSDLTQAPIPGQPLKTEVSGMAIGSLVCGFLFFFFPASVAAVVLGHLSRSEIRRSAGRKTGGGMALAGLVLGYMGVAIIPILIIAAIAIPNLLRARITANETSAVGSLRTMNTALVQYSSTYGPPNPPCGFPPGLNNLGPSGGAPPTPATADLLDNVLGVAAPGKSGYNFVYVVTGVDANGCGTTYTINATPVTVGTTGQRFFFTDETGVIRMSTGGSANADSPPIS